MSQELQALYEQVTRFVDGAESAHKAFIDSSIEYIEAERNARGEADAILANAKRSARRYVAAGVFFGVSVGVVACGGFYLFNHRVQKERDALHSIRADIKAARSANSELKELYGAEMEAGQLGRKFIELGDGWKFGDCYINNKPLDDCRSILPD